MFNPFGSSGSSSGAVAGPDSIRYKMEKQTSADKVIFSLKQILNNIETVQGSKIELSANTIPYINNGCENIGAALDELYENQGHVVSYTFEQLNITSIGKTMEYILHAIDSKNLPYNSTIIGPVDGAAAGVIQWDSAHLQIHAIEFDDTPFFICTAYSKDKEPYAWGSVYVIKNNVVDNLIPWIQIYNDKKAIISFDFYSTTDPSGEAGQPGATDTYIIQHMDKSIDYFKIVNGLVTVETLSVIQIPELETEAKTIVGAINELNSNKVGEDDDEILIYAGL